MDVTEEAMIKNKELRVTNFELFGASFLFLGVRAFIPVGIKNPYKDSFCATQLWTLIAS